ncbi:hypothetical protein P7F88_14730 [Vibrio hannami]|uniref:hypothetical protein n=1 Tax=Vibrio hannami TaxID=2717094 RepID=UPI00240ECA6D|nr:hypothetical protein [Vibrio hannami]MDG3087263.1 hypothetical protein [Vibrio hannami]
MNATYLQGIIDAESKLALLNGDVSKVYNWLNREAQIIASDYRWSDWLNGAHDFLVFHLKRNLRV